MVHEREVDLERRSTHGHLFQEALLDLPLDPAAERDPDAEALLDRALYAIGPIELHEHVDLGEPDLRHQAVEHPSVATWWRQHERLLGEVLDADPPPLRQAMAQPADEDHVLAAEDFDLELGGNLASHHDSAVDRSRKDI